MPDWSSPAAQRHRPLGSSFMTGVLALGTALASSPAVAQGPAVAPGDPSRASVGLRWGGPGATSGCLGADALARAVEEYLGRPIFLAGATDFVVAIHAEPPQGSRYRALIELFRGGSDTMLGERELVVEGRSCAALNGPLVLAVALMVDGDAALARPEAKSRATLEASPLPHTDDWELAVSLLGQAVTLPKPGPGAELALSRRLGGRLFARAELGAFLPVAATVAPPAAADLGFAFAGLGLCQGSALDPTITLRFCGAALLALTYASTEAIRGGTGQSATMLGAEAGLEGTMRVSRRLVLAASLRARFFPSAPRFVYRVDETQENVFEFQHFDGVASLGLGVTF